MLQPERESEREFVHMAHKSLETSTGLSGHSPLPVSPPCFLQSCAPQFTAQQHMRCPQGCFLTPFLCSHCPWASNAFLN